MSEERAGYDVGVVRPTGENQGIMKDLNLILDKLDGLSSDLQEVKGTVGEVKGTIGEVKKAIETNQEGIESLKMMVKQSHADASGERAVIANKIDKLRELLER